MADKKAAKEAKKAAAKEAAAKQKAEDEAKLQADLVKEFGEKQANSKSAGDPMDKLKIWLANAPYKCVDENIKVSSNTTPISKIFTALIVFRKTRIMGL